MKNRIIVIEGTDCSGKETQSKLLKERLEQQGRKVFYTSFPNYESPTGKIIGGPYLGKTAISKGWFKEGAPHVDPKVSTLFFATDRLYNIPIILEKLKEGYDIILDRYTYSAMAHQGGKMKEEKERRSFYEWVEELEFGLLNLPKPDIKVFLHMPLVAETILRKHRTEEDLDENEKDNNHLKMAEQAYIELAQIYDFKTISCKKNIEIKGLKDIKTPEEISKEVWEYVQTKLEK